MDDTPPEHSGFPDSRGSEIRLSGFAEFYGFCQVPVDRKILPIFFFLKRYWKRKFWARSARALHLFFLTISRARFARILIHLMREGGGVIATSIGVLEAWGTSFRSCQGARLDVVSALTLCNPWNYSSIFLHRFFRHYSEIPTALPA